MTARRTWKKRESNVADFFQGQRTPLSGGNSKITRSDVIHEDLFTTAEKNIKDIELNESNFKKYDFLLKLFDKADIINEINS